MAVTERTLLYLPVETSCTPSRGFSRRLWIWYSSGVMELRCLYQCIKMMIVPLTWKRDLTGLKERTSCGHTLQLTFGVIYLGLFLDKGLTRKAQLTNVMKEVYRAFCTCKGTFGKTWFLKPRVVHWMYSIVIRPILNNSTTVWWPRVGYNVSRTELSRLHRVACLAITGEMKMTPTAVIEVLLGVPVLHVMIEAEAQVGICRLMCTQQWSKKSTNFGHP